MEQLRFKPPPPKLAPSEALRLYREFLQSIPLDRLGEETREVKYVEQDLYPEIVSLLLQSLYRNYWESYNFLSFDIWFEELWNELHRREALKEFTKYYFNKEDVREDTWFKRGFRARMYRIWASFLTQLDFCYAFVYICEKLGKKVWLEANAELDRRGINLRVGQLDFQVAKISERKEARPGRQRRRKILIPYPVFNLDEYARRARSPLVSPESRRKYANILNAFNKYYLTLKNGFVVFGETLVQGIVTNLDNLTKLNDFINKVLSELSGE